MVMAHGSNIEVHVRIIMKFLGQTLRKPKNISPNGKIFIGKGKTRMLAQN